MHGGFFSDLGKVRGKRWIPSTDLQVTTCLSAELKNMPQKYITLPLMANAIIISHLNQWILLHPNLKDLDWKMAFSSQEY